MAIYLPASAEEQDVSLDELTPREIVAELDKHVVGQRAAKRAVAIALRNRQRRQKLPPDLADDMLVEFSDNFARRQLVERDVLFFGGCGQINSHSFPVLNS